MNNDMKSSFFYGERQTKGLASLAPCNVIDLSGRRPDISVSEANRSEPKRWFIKIYTFN